MSETFHVPIFHCFTIQDSCIYSSHFGQQFIKLLLCKTHKFMLVYYMQITQSQDMIYMLSRGRKVSHLMLDFPWTTL